MTILLEERVPRTLDGLVREWASDDHRGERGEKSVAHNRPFL